MKTQSAKAKGRNLQKLVVKKLLEAFPELTVNDVRSTSMGAQGVDVQLSEAAGNKFPFAIECKFQQKLKGIYDMWEQANSHKGGHPVLIIKNNHKAPLAILDLDMFLFLAKQWK